MPVSVVIASLGRSPGLDAALDSVLASLGRLGDGAELVLSLNGPAARENGGPRIRHPMLRVVRAPLTGAAHARNEGMVAAVHPVVLFTDDDCLVSESWALDHLTALRRSPASAAPATVAHRGPITRYLDYKRIFIAPPLDAGTCRYFVTANCGVNRDLLRRPPCFDEENFNNAAEDAALGYGIVEDGDHIRWLADVPPVVHALADRPSELIERSFRYGAGNATLVDVHGRWQESSPSTLEWLTSILAGEWSDYRRFTELADQDLRASFTDLNIVETAVWLAGYLTRTQEALDRTAFAIDRAGLDAAMSRLLAAQTLVTSIPTAAGGGDRYPLFAKALRAVCVPTGDQAAADAVRAHLHTHRRRVEAERARVRRVSLDIWSEWAECAGIGTHGADLDLTGFEAALRRGGVSLADALSELERVVDLPPAGSQPQPVLYRRGSTREHVEEWTP